MTDCDNKYHKLLNITETTQNYSTQALAPLCGKNCR